MAWLGVGVLLGVLFVAAPAAANDLPPTTPAASAAPEAIGPGPAQSTAPMLEPPVAPKSQRPVFMALLAAGFLIFAGVVGANDRIHGDKKPPSKRSSQIPRSQPPGSAPPSAI